MRRYYYNEKMETGMNLSLQGEIFHHIFDVCRLQVGQHFELLNDSGKAYLAEVESIGKKSAEVKIIEERALPVLKEPHIYLYMSFPKVSTFESVVEKSVEMGVKSIVPFLSDFSHFRTKSQFPTEKLPRWKKIILQATQQSGRGDLLQIEDVKTLEEILGSLHNSPLNSPQSSASNILNVISYEGETPLTLKQFLAAQRHKSHFQRINIFVGSEGGFSYREVESFKKLDLVPVTLGEQVLRVETACMTLVSSLKYEFEI